MFNLESRGPYRLGRPPLAQALAQVRFPLVARLQTLEGIAPLQDRLTSRLPYMEQKQMTEMAVMVGPGGASDPQVGTSTTWEFTDGEGTVLSLSAGIATLSAGANYPGRHEFGSLFGEVLETLAGEAHITRCDRVGARYLSIVESAPTGERLWTSWFRPEVTGWMGAGVLSDNAAVLNSLTQTALAASAAEALEMSSLLGDVQGIIRHGLVQQGSVIPGVPPVTLETESFILDLDVFLISAQPFDPSSLVGEFRQLHSQLDRFFRWSLTEEGEQEFELEELEAQE